MRYVIADISKDFVPLQNEIQHLQNYIELQRLRLGETVEVNFDISGVSAEHRIAPLILIPFVENAFKYGIMHDAISVIDLYLRVAGNELRFQIQNKIEPELNAMIQNGTGLENVRKRLELTYPAGFDLSIQDNRKDFTVALTLKLNK